MNREVPVKIGDTFDINITGHSHIGEGIGRYEGFTIFIPFAIPGEMVSCRVEEIKKGFARAQLVKVKKPVTIRQKASCPEFFKCGGSHLQHMAYPAQLEIKQQIVADNLRRIGKLNDLDVLPAIGMDEPWNYRNKAVFQLKEQEGKTTLGFFEENSHEVTTSYNCMLLDKQIIDIAGVVESLINKYHIPIYSWDTGSGILRHVVIRGSRSQGKAMVVLVTSSEKCPQLLTLAKELHHNPGVTSVVRNINDNPGRAIFGFNSQVLAGRGTVEDELCGLKFNISPTSFYQVNPTQTEVLYQKIKEFAGLVGEETVLDVYCGIGTITLYLAQFAQKVIGLEVHEAATADAAANARENGIINAEFIVGRAEERLPKMAQQGVVPDVVVVDPPRKGVDKRALLAIAEMKPERIVYVSCDSASMARDLDFLRYRGYKAVKVQPVDMFPQTYHVECVALMSRVKHEVGLSGQH